VLAVGEQILGWAAKGYGGEVLLPKSLACVFSSSVNEHAEEALLSRLSGTSIAYAIAYRDRTVRLQSANEALELSILRGRGGPFSFFWRTDGSNIHRFDIDRNISSDQSSAVLIQCKQLRPLRSGGQLAPPALLLSGHARIGKRKAHAAQINLQQNL
jgi:hypothetical protein